MKNKNDKKCVTFWIDKKELELFNLMYNQKSYFLRECIKKAIQNDDFYKNIVFKGGIKK